MSPDRAEPSLLTPREARRRLRLPKSVFEAVMRSELLGPRTTSGHLFEESIEHYERYGTQWQTRERFGARGWRKRQTISEMYGSMPAVPGVEFVPPPPDTYSAMRFSPPDIWS